MTLQQLAALFDLAASAGVEGLCEERHGNATWAALEQSELAVAGETWAITDRGRAFLDHVCALPLPQQTIAWRMLGQVTLPTTEIATILEDEGKPPPPPPLRRKRVIPTDSEELRLEAVRMMDAGYGMNEVKEELELTGPQAQQFFFGK